MRPRNDDGAVAVEFALVIPIVLLLFFAFCYGAMYYYYSAVAAHVARAVAHDAAMPQNGSYPDQAAELAVARHEGGSLMPGPTDLTLAPQPAPGEGGSVTATVTYELPGLGLLAHALPFLPHPSAHLSRSATARYE